jgi:hypothetical protein
VHLGVQDGRLDEVDLGARDVRAKQRQRHERGGADRKALADGGRGVAGGVQRIGALPDVLACGCAWCARVSAASARRGTWPGARARAWCGAPGAAREAQRWVRRVRRAPASTPTHVGGGGC